MKQRILLIEDEPGLVLTLSDRLLQAGYEMETAGDGPAGQALAESGRFDLLLLDLMLPGKPGLEICHDLRQRGVTLPILMLTARGQVMDKVVGFRLGADDYLTKPFEMAELLARIEALLRRVHPPTAVPPETVWQIGPLRVDRQRVEVFRGDERIELSAREYRLLCYLIEHRGEVLSRDTLLNEVWGYHAMPSTRTVDVHIAWLRQKLEANPRHPQFIQTVHGLGYRFDAPAEGKP
jgi:two-component system alkaline phosphatase synthesis response regulator PhoP